MCATQHGHGGGSSHCCGDAAHSQHGCCCARVHPHWEGCNCGAHPLRFQRRFTSRREEAEALERYLKDLEAEVEGVRERLAELKGS